MRWVTGKSRGERRLRWASLLAVGAGLLFLAWAFTLDPLETFQRPLADALFQKGQGSSNIAVVAIDDETLAEYGRIREWSRSLHAQAIDGLSEAGARVIVYDILFADESSEDGELAAAISGAGNVVLAAAGSSFAEGQDGAFYVYREVEEPPQPLRSAAAYIAHANLVADDDGRVRRMPLAIEDASGNQYFGLSTAALFLQFGREPPPVLETEGGSAHLLGREVPLEKFGTVRVNYVGGAGSFAHVSFVEVVEGTFDPALVEGRVVLIGQTATGADVHSAPLLDAAAGVQIHANTLDTLFRARFLRPVDDLFTLIAGAAFVAAAAYALPRWRPTYGIVTALALAAAYLVFGVFMFYQGYIFDFFDPPAALLLATVVAMAYRTLAERAAQREVEELFGRYVSEGVARELMRRADEGHLELGGELREVTTMFCDVRGFTAISQQVQPSEMVELLNRQFEVIVSSVVRNGGIVNKFVGDAVMAFWNAPHGREDHALLACRAAMEAQGQLEALETPGPPLRFGFGINTGMALAGNVGTAGRLEYTVIGEPVNTASRLAGAAEGGEVWIGGQTRNLVADRLEVEEMPPQQLKGMAAPIAVYRIKRPSARRVSEVGASP